MTPRQCIPNTWLILDRQPDAEDWSTFGKLRRGSGVLFLQPLDTKSQRRFRHIAAARELTAIPERPRVSARVHNQRELTLALSRRTTLIFLSPIHPTRSHPDWRPLPRMRAATLARLARRQAIALGGMNRRRYARIAPLGFIGWAGISAFRT